MDVATVVFEDELTVLQIQAQSLDLYLPASEINSIMIMVNDHESLCEKIEPRWWGQHQSKVTIIHRSRYAAHWPKNGWVGQQVLKLMAADSSGMSHTLILDAKTILVKEFRHDIDGLIASGIYDIQEVFQPAAEICGQMFGSPCTKVAGPGGVPFLMINHVVQQMIDHIGREDFVTWFVAQGCLTEFVLYSSYIDKILDGLEKYYVPGFTLQNVNVCHSEIGCIDSKLDSMLDPLVYAVSIHRHAWKNFSQQQKDRFRRFLMSKDITKADLLYKFY